MAETSVDQSKGPTYENVAARAAASDQTIRTALEEDVVGGSFHKSYGDMDGQDNFVYHDKLQLPPAPKGTEWAYQISTHRWDLQPLAKAEITVLDSNTSWSTSETPLFLNHWVQSTDTFVGLCLKYGITGTQLRRANFGFSGTNLSLAPNPLRIPNISRAVPEQTDREKIIKTLQLIFQGELTKSEVKCYLELNDWDVNQAIQNAKRDLQEKKISSDPSGERARFDTHIETVVIDEGFDRT